MLFRKKVLYYGLMLLLTLLALEGMARIAGYAAYGQGYGGGIAGPAAIAALPAENKHFHLRHPFYGYAGHSLSDPMNAMPPRQRRGDPVLIGLLGGSVAERVQPFLQDALEGWFAANNLTRRPVVLDLAASGAKQPQQTLLVANALLLGGEFDLLINLDGNNELANSAGLNPQNGVFPFFPMWWERAVGLTAAEVSRAGQIGILRREQARLAAAGATSPLRWSAVFGLANRYRQERIAAEINQRNHELAAVAAGYNLEKYGPRTGRNRDDTELLMAAARVWYRGSLMLSRLADLGGAEYYHFLQPSQYAPDAKPLSAAELAVAYKPEGGEGSAAARGYPLLRLFNQELRSQGVNYFDLTGIFADRPETLYIDECCHLNPRGNELLAAAIVARLEPALQRLGAGNPSATDSRLAPARRPAEPDLLLFSGDFQVYLQEGVRLHYVREDCAPADVEPRFFLHLTPRDLADLPPPRREPGFDNRDFSFAGAGGRRWQGQCIIQIPLPGYPIAALRTGQYVPGQGDLWSVDLIATP